MDEYIKREALIEELERIYHAHYVKAREQSIHDVFKAVFKRLSNAPAADVVEVCRCRECIHDGLTSCPLCYIEKHTLCFVNHDAEFYCGNGERRSE